MKESYRPDLKAHVLTDEANRVRAIRHTGEYWESYWRRPDECRYISAPL